VRRIRALTERGLGGPAAEGGSQERHGIVIVGAGGFGGEVLQYVLDAFGADPCYGVKGFLDDHPPDLSLRGLSVPVIGTVEGYVVDPTDRIVIAIGDPAVRLRIADGLAARGAAFLTLVHPLASVAPTATIGPGCILAPYATVGAHAAIGEHTVLTFYASVAHDARVGRGCTFSPHAVTNGGSCVGDGVFLGAHAAVNPLKSVGAGSRLTAGSVVYRNIPPGSLASGNPAKVRKLWSW